MCMESILHLKPVLKDPMESDDKWDEMKLSGIEVIDIGYNEHSELIVKMKGLYLLIILRLEADISAGFADKKVGPI